MQKKWLGGLGWLIIVVVAFWGGRLTKLDTVRIEKVPGPESVIYKIDDIPLEVIVAFLGAQNLTVWPKWQSENFKAEEARIRAIEHSFWQDGYKAGYIEGHKR